MTSNIFLNNFLSKLSEFGGVYNVSTIQSMKYKTLPCYIICNLSKAGTPGSHWIGLALYSKKVIFFDSFGRGCKNEKILKFLVDKGYRTYFYSKFPVQHVFSNKCGEYVLGFILTQKHGIKLESYLNLFKKSKIENDKKLGNLIKFLSNIYLK